MRHTRVSTKMVAMFPLVLFACVAGASATVLKSRATGGYIQNPSGAASFTFYSGCGSPACGKTATGYTAAMNQLAFGSPPGLGAGDACGRCFAVTGTADPFSPAYTGPFHSIVVKVTDLWLQPRERERRMVRPNHEQP
ncbi:hypothetical protein D9615_007488 [Tricholomella constricta]|uniref:Expansin-like EG45 domain-containing protein n=1 Tax=Tricholomella constricta TaxID=117010 RepID=A0A8H5LX53_9AGAR|nr:hypothetical protein D9615_007488 [Tricholomella constricta]